MSYVMYMISVRYVPILFLLLRYVLSISLYGLSLGCLLYSSKMYCYNSVKAKDFAHVWSLVSASQSFSSLAGIMVTGIGGYLFPINMPRPLFVFPVPHS